MNTTDTTPTTETATVEVPCEMQLIVAGRGVSRQVHKLDYVVKERNGRHTFTFGCGRRAAATNCHKTMHRTGYQFCEGCFGGKRG